MAYPSGPSQMQQQTRNLTLGRDNEVASVRTLRSTARSRLYDQEYPNILPLNEERLFTPILPEPNIFLDSDALAVECQFSEALSSHSRNTNRLGRSRENICGSRSSFCHYDVGMARSFMSHDGLTQYNLDGIAEVLLALERIQQDEELTSEQLVVLETNLFLNGLAFHDQHRDMRLDIDNMSYEELLAFEERMGSVSTAPSEEPIAKCLKRSSYRETSLEAATTGIEGNDDDVKCSNWQEEYGEGDEVGRLECEHTHVPYRVHTSVVTVKELVPYRQGLSSTFTIRFLSLLAVFVQNQSLSLANLLFLLLILFFFFWHIVYVQLINNNRGC